MTVSVHLNRLEEWPELGAAEGRVREAAWAALDAAAGGREGELSVTCLPLEEMEEMNREYLGREGPTDVVAFDLGEGERVLGDVYVSPEMALRAAAEGAAGSAEEELLRLVVHGTLHALGHTHPEGEERWESPMFRLQEEVLARLLGEEPPRD